MGVAELPELPAETESPWVESRAGGLFFVNALIAAPALMAVYPLLLRSLLEGLVGLDRPSPILDTVPLVAAYVAPWVGWMAVPAAVLVLWNLRMVDRRWPRVLLWAFLAIHLAVLGYTVGRWIGWG